MQTSNSLPALELGARARAMSLDDAGLILTLADEPELILEPGQSAPALDARDIAAARLRSAWAMAELLNAGSAVQ